VAIQRRLATRVRTEGDGQTLRLVAGVDAAFSRDGTRVIAGVIVWDIETNEVVEERIATRALRLPYIPGLLSFREMPAILAAVRKLRTTPDVFVCDGQGLAHPRRFGVACHLGVVLDLPAVGCAKSRLIGEHRDPGQRRGSCASLVDRGERVGTVLRTRDGVRPVFVSVGHRIGLPAAERLILDTGAGYRLPEPTRRADQLVGASRER